LDPGCYLRVERCRLLSVIFRAGDGTVLFLKGNAPYIPRECSLSNGILFLLLPFSPHFTNLAFSLYYHKMPNGIISIVLIY